MHNVCALKMEYAITDEPTSSLIMDEKVLDGTCLTRNCQELMRYTADIIKYRLKLISPVNGGCQSSNNISYLSST